MQIMFILIISLAIVAFIIYKINNRFGTKEFIILLIILVLGVAMILFFAEEKKTKVPEIFKAKYEKDKNVKIEKLSFERLNNKTVTSNTNFIYNFDFIVLKNGEEFICNIKELKIRKIEDEYVFDNYDKIKQECKKK